MSTALAAEQNATFRAKSPEAFRTISEVAAELDVPQHVLRFWESRFVQVKPVKRGGGRRYYRPEDVDLLRGIRTLLYSDGLTIKGVQKLLREQGVRYIADLGRGRDSLLGRLAEAGNGPGHDDDDDDDDLETDDVPRHARAAIAVVHAAHTASETVFDAAPDDDGDMADAVNGDTREHLEELLAELLRLKGQLAAARA